MKRVSIAILGSLALVTGAARAEPARFVIDAEVAVTTTLPGTPPNELKFVGLYDGQRLPVRSVTWSCAQLTPTLYAAKGGEVYSISIQCSDGKTALSTHAPCFTGKPGDTGYGHFTLTVGDVSHKLSIQCVTSSRPVPSSRPVAQPVVLY